MPKKEDSNPSPEDVEAELKELKAAKDRDMGKK
jgi:hypothetical protein